MSLSRYKEKRKFDITPEPEGGKKSSAGSLRFVIQKHDATNLHYDFRLEMAGVLKSWAVPKGPSLNPADKRLAMMVEDHPYDYRNFEGIIPEGNYGGGTVIVWDEGTYTPMEPGNLSRKEQEKLLLKQLHSGDLKLELHGKKIKGSFALFQMKGRGENAWLLVKKADKHASDKNILDKDRSVKSGKTLATVAKENGMAVKHPEVKTSTTKRSTSTVKKASAKKAVAPKKATKPAAAKKKVGPLKNLPAEYKNLISQQLSVELRKPMLATLGDAPFDDADWIYEIKWDGYRALALCNGGSVELVSRNLVSFAERYEPVADALRELNINAVVDGEVVAVNEKGLAVFQSLQNWQNTPVQLQYCVFDLMWVDGYDITGLPLVERKKILQQLIPAGHPVLRYSDHVAEKGYEFFQAALRLGLEGVMAKKADSVYQYNARSADWIKIKVARRQEVVIAGYTEPRNSRKHFGSLLLGLYEGDELVYIGHTGSGFNTRSLEDIYNALQPLVIKDCPFKDCPKGNMPVTWVQPKLVCEIKFTEWTKDRIARHPIFMGLRIDKKPKEARFEKEITMATMKKTAEKDKKTATKKAATKKATTKAAAKKLSAKVQPVKRTGRKTATKKASSKATQAIQVDASEGQDQLIKLDGHELKLTNLNKLYWKKEQFTKGDMINYYLRIAPYMLPYMMDRPQSLNRHPNGIDGPNFYQKDQKGKLPGWMITHKDFSESTNKTVEYLVCNNTATLVYMANLGCIEMHPWHARRQSWQQPDWCLIDLDPDTPNTFDQVMSVARLVKQVLDSIGADAYCKTSGSTGIHIYIPLGAKYSYDQSKQLAELVASLVLQEMPEITSMERSPAKRKGKIYLDYLQNRETQTAAAPYSLRPKPGVPVSTPLDWSELKKGLTSKTFNAHNIFDRLKTDGDLFKPVMGKGINLDKVLSKLASLIQ